MTENNVSLHLPLKEWSIGAGISPQEVTLAPLANLVLESGRLKVKDANGSTQFDLQLKEGSVDIVKYVDVKVGPLLLGKVNSKPSFRKLRPQSHLSRFTPLYWLLYKVTLRSNSNPVCFSYFFFWQFLSHSYSNGFRLC